MDRDNAPDASRESLVLPAPLPAPQPAPRSAPETLTSEIEKLNTDDEGAVPKRVSRVCGPPPLHVGVGRAPLSLSAAEEETV